MEERKELKKKQDDILLENVTNEISINKESSIEELLIVLDVIINGSKIIENAKKVEELKSLFYLKLKEDIINSNEITKDKSTYEIDFKEKINLYKAKKKSIRDEILRDEKINLKIKCLDRFRKYFGVFYNRKLMLLKFYSYFNPLKIKFVKNTDVWIL